MQKLTNEEFVACYTRLAGCIEHLIEVGSEGCDDEFREVAKDAAKQVERWAARAAELLRS